MQRNSEEYNDVPIDLLGNEDEIRKMTRRMILDADLLERAINDPTLEFWRTKIENYPKAECSEFVLRNESPHKHMYTDKYMSELDKKFTINPEQ